MRLVQAYLCPGKTRESRFNRRGGAVKLMQTCFCDWKDLESSFHHCAVPVKPI